MKDPILSWGEAASESLHKMVREILARRPGGHLVEAQLDEVDLTLPLVLRGEGSDPSAFARAVRAALEALVDDAVQRAAAFRPGHAFCHRCQDAACEHSMPPSSRHVFAGYGPTGLPRWNDLAQHCLDRRHPDVDRLYADPPAFVALVEEAARLKRTLLGAFESDRHELLGQVLAGFWPVPSRLDEGRGVLALSFQVAASRRRDGKLQLGLNVLGRAPGGEALAMLWERQPDLPWRRAVRWAQAALGRAAGAPGAAGRAGISARTRERVDGILAGLARRLERDARARGRRTAHAEQRHGEGTRPTRSAVQDVRGASPDAVLRDERSGAYVVLGDRGRTHFFSPEGRLISSARYSRDAIERKKKQGLWRDGGPDAARMLARKVGSS